MKIHKKAVSLAVPVVMVFLFALTAHAATPVLSLSVSSGDSVNVTVTGDANSTVNFYYNVGSSSGMQIRNLGATDSNGNFSTLVSTSGYGINSGASVYVIVNSQQSSMMSWPYTATTSGTLSVSQNNISLSQGQSTTVYVYGSSNTVYVASNSNPSVANFVVSGTQVAVTGNNPGSTSANLCDQNNQSRCILLSVTTQSGGTGGQAVTFGQSSVNLSGGTGQIIIISISGGGGSYYVSNNSNASAVSAVINGSSVNLSANSNNAASASLTICSSSTSSCGVLYVTVNGGGGTTSGGSVSFSQSSVSLVPGASQSVSISGSGTYSISSNSNPSVVSPSISGNTLNLYAVFGAAGSATITVCQQSGGCGTVAVTVGSSGTSGQIYLSQSSVSLTIGQSATVTVSGGSGSGSYYVSSNSASGVASASLNGSVLTSYGLTNGSTAVSICSLSTP